MLFPFGASLSFNPPFALIYANSPVSSPLIDGLLHAVDGIPVYSGITNVKLLSNNPASL